MKLQVIGTVKRLNVKHRIMMTLCFIDFKLNGTKACGEPFSPELTAEGLSRIEFRRVDTFCSVFF
jgi:hypothetical protein